MSSVSYFHNETAKHAAQARAEEFGMEFTDEWETRLRALLKAMGLTDVTIDNHVKRIEDSFVEMRMIP